MDLRCVHAPCNECSLLTYKELFSSPSTVNVEKMRNYLFSSNILCSFWGFVGGRFLEIGRRIWTKVDPICFCFLGLIRSSTLFLPHLKWSNNRKIWLTHFCGFSLNCAWVMYLLNFHSNGEVTIWRESTDFISGLWNNRPQQKANFHIMRSVVLIHKNGGVASNPYRFNEKEKFRSSNVDLNDVITLEMHDAVVITSFMTD